MSSDTAVTGSRPSTGRGWPRLLGILVLAWAILLGLVIGLGQVITGPLSDSIGAADTDIARWFAGERTSTLNEAAEYVSLLGDTRTELVLAPLIALGLWAWQRSIRPALFVALSAAGVGGIYILAAMAVERPRPPVKILDPGLNPMHSFPSGHVGTATALWGLIIILVWTYAWSARRWATPLLLVPPLVVVSRVYEGAHHLSDVLTSIAFASGWLAVVAMLLLPARSPSRSMPDS